MLLELYISLEILGLILFAVAYFRKSELFWSLAIVIFAVLIFASYNIEKNVTIVSNQTTSGNTVSYHYDIVSKQIIDKTYSYLNMGFFGLALLLFFYDLFQNWRENKSAQR